MKQYDIHVFNKCSYMLRAISCNQQTYFLNNKFSVSDIIFIYSTFVEKTYLYSSTKIVKKCLIKLW